MPRGFNISILNLDSGCVKIYQLVEPLRKERSSGANHVVKERETRGLLFKMKTVRRRKRRNSRRHGELGIKGYWRPYKACGSYSNQRKGCSLNRRKWPMINVVQRPVQQQKLERALHRALLSWFLAWLTWKPGTADDENQTAQQVCGGELWWLEIFFTILLFYLRMIVVGL